MFEQEYSTFSAVYAKDNRIFLGGLFYTAPATYTHQVLEIDMDGNIVNTDLQFDNLVTQIFGQESKLYLSGKGYSGSNLRPGIARFSLATGQLDDWAPELVGYSQQPSGSPIVRDIAFHDDRIIIGGRFISINGEPKTHLASFNQNTGQLESWSPETNGSINSIVAYNDVLYVGGAFNAGSPNFGGQTRKHLGALDLITGLATDWNPLIDNTIGSYLGGQVSKLSINNNTLYVVGAFRQVLGQNRLHTAAINLEMGELIDEWTFHTDWRVNDIAFNNDDFFMVGDFGSAGGIYQENAVAIDIQTGLPIDWSLNVDGIINDVNISDNRLYIAGEGNYTDSNGINRMGLGAIDLSTGLFSDWQPEFSLVNVNFAIVEKVKARGNNVFVTGHFEIEGIYNQGRLRAFDKVSGLPDNWTLLTPQTLDFDFWGDSIFLITSEVVNYTPYQHIRTINANTQTFSNTDISVNGANTLQIYNDLIFVGGDFSHIADTLRKNVASFELDGLSITQWMPSHYINEPKDFLVLNEQIMAVGTGVTNPYQGISAQDPYGYILTNSLGSVDSQMPIVNNGNKMLIYNDQLFLAGQMSIYNPFQSDLNDRYLYNDFNVINISPCESPILCQDYTLNLNASGEAELLAENVVDVSNSCSEANITLSINTFNCDDLGMHNVNVVYLDVFGNTSSCTSNITVVALADEDLDGIGDACDFCFGDNDSGDLDGDGICDDAEIVGCQDETACDFNPDATDPGTCLLIPQIDCSFCDPTPGVEALILIDDDGDGVCNPNEIVGCQDPDAVNYNPNATEYGLCLYAFGAGQGISLNPGLGVDGGRPENTSLAEFYNQSINPNNDWNVTVFPNPWNGASQLQLQFSNASLSSFTIEIYDIAGRLMFSKPINNAKNKTIFSIPTTTNFENGTYLISIVSMDGERKSQLLIINN